MTEHNLPPERRLDDQSRARMRAELTEETARSTTPRARSWLVPAAAAAAVASVAALGTVLMTNGDDGGPDRTEELAPAGSGTAGDQTQGPSVPDPGSSKGMTEQTLQAAPLTDPPATCADEVPAYLPGAAEAARTTYDEGLAVLFTKGQSWVLCDDWAASADGGAPTLLGNRATNDPAAEQTYALSQNYSMTNDSVAQFVAGGPTLPGVQSISYTFPDGHTQQAVMGDDMWLMAYVPTSGPLVDLETAQTEPIHVVVTRAGGGRASYDLQWGQDSCAQINHGC
ncbi:hypothetical protein [Nocardioides jensenii]|uniref:hypothetical protein n=1 Tax=Nocardioides jensenii TaxID=1843 RepID=UPI00082ADAD9|nr:hypothetical protein [Nocardioides jensenii]